MAMTGKPPPHPPRLAAIAAAVDADVIRRQMMGQKMNGAEALVESLVRENVTAVFGLPGGANMPIYDALYEHPVLAHYLVRHEQAAAMMAEGYAKATGKVGVA